AEDGIRARNVTGVQTCALPISANAIDVISTSPSGTIGTRAATMPIRESRAPALVEASWLTIVRMPAGINRNVTNLRIRSTPDRKIGRASCRGAAWDAVGAGRVQ